MYLLSIIKGKLNYAVKLLTTLPYPREYLVGILAICGRLRYSEEIEGPISRLQAHHIEVRHGSDYRLRFIGAYASYLPRKGRVGIIFIGRDSTYSDLMHELRHFYHDRLMDFAGRRRYMDLTTSGVLDYHFLNELEAERFSLINRLRWGDTDQRIEEHCHHFVKNLNWAYGRNVPVDAPVEVVLREVERIGYRLPSEIRRYREEHPQ